jgi:predicted enzyme related to lactoylglutathione lyase
MTTMLDVRRAARLGVLTLTALLAVPAGAAEPADRYWPPIVDPATNQYTPGRWVWGDLVTSDVAAAAEFYGKVFGWTYETYGGEDDRDTYTLVLAAGLPIGGMVFDQRAMKGDVPSARWIGLVSVPDVKAAAAAVSANGGKVVVAPKMLGERGETAVFQDPEGVPFGAVRSKHGDPADYSGDVNEWVWLDLWTRDVERATKFYSEVAGYRVVPLEQDGPRSGAHLLAGDYVRAGVMRLNDERTTPLWLPYVRVKDAKAAAQAARAAGGEVLREPVSVGRAVVAVIADPTGAPVGIAQLNDTEAAR